VCSPVVRVEVDDGHAPGVGVRGVLGPDEHVVDEAEARADALGVERRVAVAQ
jgi:hypothetical protein